VIGQSGVSLIAGGTRQVFEWTGVRHYAAAPSERVHGIVIADSFANHAAGSYAYDAYAKASPERTWRAHRAQLERIRARMTFYGVPGP